MKTFQKKIFIATFLFMALFISAVQGQATGFNGPLKVSEKNPRYFTDNSGKAVYLTGSHTWNNLVDMTSSDNPDKFDYKAYLDWIKKYNHNFMRMWAWELLSWNTEGNREKKPRKIVVEPHPWLRTGPGQALDGNLKFDLERLNPEYFTRLEERIKLASDAGIYVSVMLFEGWGLQFSPGAFENHPFHPGNNINGINGDANGDGSATEIHTIGDVRINSIQKAYMMHVLDVLNKYDNVLYEISNENHPPSTEWQYDIIRFIKNYEKSLPKQHPVGMTFQYRGGSNKALFDSPADWISPNPEGGYRDNPSSADGSKVILNDTDHLWGLGGNPGWIWKSFIRGMNPIFMDPYDCRVLANACDEAWLESMRKGQGFTRMIANRADLISMVPHPEMASTSYCLANKGSEYLFYLPDTAIITIDLENAAGKFTAQWFDTGTGKFFKGQRIKGGKKVTMNSPTGVKNTVVHLYLKSGGTGIKKK